MSVLWAWSDRALKALHLLAKEWTSQLAREKSTPAELLAVCKLLASLTQSLNGHGGDETVSDAACQFASGDDSFFRRTFIDTTVVTGTTGQTCNTTPQDSHWDLFNTTVLDETFWLPEST